MKLSTTTVVCVLVAALLGCAAPPKSDGSKVDLACAQQCSANLTSCSSGFKLFPVVAQQQCNDTYDVCIKACPDRTSSAPSIIQTTPTTAERLKKLNELFTSGAITKEEYDAKRKDILGSL